MASFLGGAAGALGGGVVGRAVVELVGDSARLRQDLNQSKTETAQATQQMGQSSSRFSAVHKVAMLAAAAATVKFVVDSIRSASDLGEQMNVAREQFGAAADQVVRFAEDSKQIGIAKAQALEAASGFGAMFDQLAQGNQVSADMSVRMVQLAADMASFRNQDPAEMLDRLRSALAGQARPLRQFGVFISESRVQAQAYKDGIAEVGEELTDGQKIQARYNLILEDTQKAHGDFARTVGESLPNQLRVAKAELTDLQAEFGVALMPAVIAVIKAFRALFAAIGPLLVAVGQLAGGILELVSPVFDLLAALAEINPLLPVVAVAFAVWALRAGVATVANLAFAGSLSQVGFSLDQVRAQATATSASVQGVGMSAGKAAGILGLLVYGLNQAGNAMREWINELEGNVDITDAAASYTEELASRLADGSMSLDEVRKVAHLANEKLAEFGESSRVSVDDVLNLASANRAAKESAAQAAGEFEGQADAHRDAADAAREQRAAELELAGGLLGIEGAMIRAEQAAEDLAAARRLVNRLEERGKKGTDAYAEATDDLRAKQLDAIESQISLKEAVFDYAKEIADSESDQNAAIRRIKEFGEEAGLTKGEINDLLERVLDYIRRDIPQKKVTIDTHPADIALRNWLDRVESTKVGVEVVAQGFAQRLHVGGLARGSSGEIDAKLIPGEYVLNKDMVREAGLSNLERWRLKSLREPMPEYHAGGLVKGMPHSHIDYDFGGPAAAMAQLFEDAKAASMVTGGAGTLPVQRFAAAVFAAFPGLQNWGIKSVRTIAGTSTWSQHAFGNAIDISKPGYPASLDPVNAWVQARRALFSIRNVLFRTMTGGNHFNHMHVDFNPPWAGNPVTDGYPVMDRGGITRGPAFVGSRRKEAHLPLDSPQTQEVLAGALKTAMVEALGSGRGRDGGSRTIVVKIGEREFARVVDDAMWQRMGAV